MPVQCQQNGKNDLTLNPRWPQICKKQSGIVDSTLPPGAASGCRGVSQPRHPKLLGGTRRKEEFAAPPKTYTKKAHISWEKSDIHLQNMQRGTKRGHEAPNDYIVYLQ